MNRIMKSKKKYITTPDNIGRDTRRGKDSIDN